MSGAVPIRRQVRACERQDTHQAHTWTQGDRDEFRVQCPGLGIPGDADRYAGLTPTPLPAAPGTGRIVMDELQADEARRAAIHGIRGLLMLMGEDPTRTGLADTPERVIRAYQEMTDAPGDPADLLSCTFTDADYPADEMVAVGPVAVTSLCEHHLLPFTGAASVAYLPTPGNVVGLSKLARLVDHYARRPQVQERLTTQIADAITTHLDTLGAACVIRATHACMSLRGVSKTDAVMTTSVLRGRFSDRPATRAEFLALTRNGH